MYKYTAAPCGAQDVRAVPCAEITRAGANGAGLVMRNVVEPGRLHTDGGRHPHITGDFPGARRQKICRFEVADKEKCPTMTSAAILAASTARLRAGFKLFRRAVRQSLCNTRQHVTRLCSTNRSCSCLATWPHTAGQKPFSSVLPKRKPIAVSPPISDPQQHPAAMPRPKAEAVPRSSRGHELSLSSSQALKTDYAQLRLSRLNRIPVFCSTRSGKSLVSITAVLPFKFAIMIPG